MIWIFEVMWEHLRWSASIIKKLATIVPGYTTLVVSASLISQVAIVLAFALPLKIVLLMATPGIPKYFPSYFADYERDFLALGLGGAAAGFYVLYLLTTRIVDTGSWRGADLLLYRARKLALFANQEGIAKQAYERFSTSVAGLLFAGLGLLVMALMYPRLVGFLVGMLLFFLLVTAGLGQITSAREWITEHVSDLTEVLAALFFLSSCAFIVLDFIFGEGVNFIIAIVSVLLSRQIGNRLSSVINDAIKLTQQKLRVNALFFHSKVLLPPGAHQDKGFWSLLDRHRRVEWLGEVLADDNAARLTNVQSWLHQTGPRGVVGLDVKVVHENPGEVRWFFVKLYNGRQRAQAMHEATLLGDPGARALPAPELVTTVSVGDFQCLVYEAVPGGRVRGGQLKNTAREIMVRCWQVEPSEALINRYRRSTPLLVHRLDEDLLYRLQMAFNTPKQGADLARFEESLNDIRDILESLPLFIYNPDLKLDMINSDAEGNIVATHWGKWSLEPVGAGWPLVDLDQMESQLESVAKESDRLAHLAPHRVRLAALIFAFEWACYRDNYVSAIEMLPRILACLDAEYSDIDSVNQPDFGTSST